jgi:cysteinyl-tRNA synthetase
LGVIQLDRSVDDWEGSSAISELVAKREEARKNKDFQESDRIRDELKRQGVVVEDTPRGPVVRKLSTAA